MLTVLIVALLTPTIRADDKPAAPTFKIECKKPADSIAISPEAKRTIIVVTSEMGIGGATIDLKSGEWPANVVIRFQYARGGRFKMLEHFELNGGRWKIAGEMHDSGKLPLQFANAEGKFDRVRPAGLVSSMCESKAKDPGIEVTLPANSLGGSKQIHLDWIDAYR